MVNDKREVVPEYHLSVKTMYRKKRLSYVGVRRVMPTKRVIIGIEKSAARAMKRNDNHKGISITVTTIIK